MRRSASSATASAPRRPRASRPSSTRAPSRASCAPPARNSPTALSPRRASASEAEALLGDRAVGLLRAGGAQLALDGARVLLGLLARGLRGADAVAELADLRIDLVAVVTAADDVERRAGGGRDAPTAVDGVLGGADRHGG